MKNMIYEATITLTDGQTINVCGSLNDCTAAVHEQGDRVKKATIKGHLVK